METLGWFLLVLLLPVALTLAPALLGLRFAIVLAIAFVTAPAAWVLGALYAPGNESRDSVVLLLPLIISVVHASLCVVIAAVPWVLIRSRREERGSISQRMNGVGTSAPP